MSQPSHHVADKDRAIGDCKGDKKLSGGCSSENRRQEKDADREEVTDQSKRYDDGESVEVDIVGQVIEDNVFRRYSIWRAVNRFCGVSQRLKGSYIRVVFYDVNGAFREVH